MSSFNYYLWANGSFFSWEGCEVAFVSNLCCMPHRQLPRETVHPKERGETAALITFHENLIILRSIENLVWKNFV